MKFKLSYLAILLSLIAVALFLTSLLAAEEFFTSTQNELVNTGNGDWFWQHPQPQGNMLLTIDCPTEDNCFAGGYLGYFSSSSNNRAFIVQGKNDFNEWSGQETEGHGINQIYCASSNICYAASSFGHVQKTTDGGQNWTVLVTNTDDKLLGIHCFNANNCLVVGENGSLLETTNGGQTWLTRTSNTNLDLQDITCLNSSTCLIVGGSGMYGTGDPIILRSQNGGDSWQTVSTQASNILNSIDCFDSNTCVAVGWGGVIQVSENAGGSWRAASAHTASILKDIECPTTEKCFLVSNDGQIYMSDDGFIWLEINTQNDISLEGISCPSSQQCTAVGENGQWLTTQNGGVDWHKVTQGTLSSTTLWTCYNDGNSCRVEYANRINDFECFADGHCLAVSHQGLYFLGDTLNASWTPYQISTTQNLRSLSCFEDQISNICYAAGSGGTVWKTADNGTSWQTTTTGVTYRLFDIDCPAGNTCIAVGEDGAAIRTINGGTSWQPVTSTTTHDLFAVKCPSTNKCVAVGENGEVVYSDNGGQTWQRPTQAPSLSTSGQLRGLDCQSENDCLVVGGDSKAVLYRTSNGGATWSLVSSLDSTFWFNDIDCSLTGICTAVGQMGSIFRSENGGDTWQEEHSGTSWSLLSANCLEDGSCFAGGEQGIILGSTKWPDILVTYGFSGSSFADNTSVTGKIEVVNRGTIPAQQIQITNTFPTNLQPNGPVTVSWGSESATIDSPNWPNILSSLNITLTTGSTLLIEFPVIVENPQQLVQSVESAVEVQADGLPRPLEYLATVTLAQHSTYAPIVSTSLPNACYGPFIDSFSSANSGWPSGNTGSTTYGYSSGEYRILHENANKWFAVTRRDLWQDDRLLELQGYQLANSGLWGFLFGLNNDWSDFYTFEVLPNYQEWYVLHFNSNSGWSVVSSGEANYILTGQGKNNLLIQGANDKMYFYINNYLVYEMDEKQGFVGITGGSFSKNAQLRYDNYLFHKSDCSAVGFYREVSGYSPHLLTMNRHFLLQND